MSEQLFLQYTEGCYKSTGIAWGTAMNKRDILNEVIGGINKEIELASSEEEKRVLYDKRNKWQDLRTRAQWCTNFLGHRDLDKTTFKTCCQSLLNHIYISAGGTKRYQYKTYQLLSPVSFVTEPCDLCKALEYGFYPDDLIIRTPSEPWTTQYDHMLQSLVADAYKVIGSGYYYYNKIQVIKDTLTGNSSAGVPWTKILSMWDIILEWGRNFLYFGRQCFVNTELKRQQEFYNMIDGRLEPVSVAMNDKYFHTNEFTMKCEGGLFALNTDLLCDACKANLEDDPIELGYNDFT